jgi:hypothetical protein
MSGFNPYAAIRKAAHGDLEAQRALADFALHKIREGDRAPFVTLQEGLCFARMAMAHGEPQDRRRVYDMLGLGSLLATDPREKLECDAEAIALMADLADQGSEEAGRAMIPLADWSSPEALELARFIQTLMSEGE